MKNLFVLFSTFIILITTSTNIDASDETEYYKREYRWQTKLLEGSLLPIKNNINVDVVFNYSRCFGSEFIGDELTTAFIETLSNGEKHFCELFNQETNNKLCTLIHNGNNSEFTLKFDVYELITQSTIKSTRLDVLLGGVLYLYQKDNQKPIAILRFNSYASHYKSDMQKVSNILYESLIKPFSKQINKAKAPKTKK